VVAADRQGVAVPGHDPDREVGSGQGQPVASAGARRGCLHPVGVHVVGKRPAQPMPATQTIRSGGSPARAGTAARGQDRVSPQPGTSGVSWSDAKSFFGQRRRAVEPLTLTQPSVRARPRPSSLVEPAAHSAPRSPRRAPREDRQALDLAVAERVDRNPARMIFTSCPVLTSGSGPWIRAHHIAGVEGSGLRWCKMRAATFFHEARTRLTAP